MNLRFQPIPFMLSVSLAVLIFSCGKSKLNRETTSSKDDQIAENKWDDVLKMVEESQDENLEGSGKTNLSGHIASSCATLSILPNGNTWPKTLTLDFGLGCTGSDGKVRMGQIVAVYTGKYRQSGTTITITTNNYVVDGYQVEGTKVVTNQGNNSSGQLQYNIVVDGRVTTPGGDQIQRQATRTRTWVEGQNTGFFTLNADSTIMGLSGILDDVWEIAGTGSGTNREGRDYTYSITENLKLQWCGLNPQITSGQVQIVPGELKTRNVDFGTGDCDNQATVSIGNREYQINLRN